MPTAPGQRLPCHSRSPRGQETVACGDSPWWQARGRAREALPGNPVNPECRGKEPPGNTQKTSPSEVLSERTPEPGCREAASRGPRSAEATGDRVQPEDDASVTSSSQHMF